MNRYRRRGANLCCFVWVGTLARPPAFRQSLSHLLSRLIILLVHWLSPLEEYQSIISHKSESKNSDQLRCISLFVRLLTFSIFSQYDLVEIKSRSILNCHLDVKILPLETINHGNRVIIVIVTMTSALQVVYEWTCYLKRLSKRWLIGGLMTLIGWYNNKLHYKYNCTHLHLHMWIK